MWSMGSVQRLPPADLTLNKYSLEYTFEELERATNGFDPSYKLGNGGFGAVYRGEQTDGTDVAIKVLEMPEEAGFEEEVRVLSKFRHPNLVILMGFARRDFQRMLIYELLGGGDVYKRLEKSNTEGLPFTWRQRVSAAFDAACGLSHLHNSKPKVFHRDIKSPNILLDRNGTAKMADFGLACLSDAKAHKVDNAAGTIGYACPLYSERCVVTEGSEAYSFGIVLFELLTATPPAWILRSPDGTRQYQFLAGHINGDAGAAMSLADIHAHWPQQVGHSLAELAIQCTRSEDEQRPRFTNIVTALRKLRDAPDAPSPPESPDRVHRCQAVPVPQRCIQPSPRMPAESPRMPAEMPPLWSLHCELVEGVESLSAIPSGFRSVVHRQEPGHPWLTLFKVGRLVQEDFFQAILPDDNTRNAVSREHFQIWAAPACDGLVPHDVACGSVPCSFFVSNLSRTWTMVNEALLDASGKCAQIHSGDYITLGRRVPTPEGARYSTIVRFRFDLSGSMLYDIDEEDLAAPRALGAAGGA
uniref:Protein kinase domain-containing protein n=1 Tax=Alexandrium catenella TaxID=2925 RepID=A0A7S1L6M5_ALECA|mmetsp:Transcript_107492/g.285995  ORF Transcript_107492/g.285995 Transcript_107492/m.285995 type:complete len:528 (+) Transcript_107492:79-1662(+)